MDEIYSVSIESLIEEFNLEVLYLSDEHPVNIDCMEVNRPGICLTGFFELFEPRRIEIMGQVEHRYLETLSEEARQVAMEALFSHKPAAVIITKKLDFDAFIPLAKKYDVPMLRTTRLTSEFMAALIGSLSLSLAPRITRHGVFVEVYGEGVFITGDSGIGKSETAIELVKRGHRLIADDAVEIKKASAKSLIGSAPELIRHYIELRGIGIIDARRIFGMGSVKTSDKIDLVVHLEPWDSEKNYDRFGLDTDYEEIMGISIPKITIPVQPGRNLAVIVEIAAMNNRQKKMGYNTAEEFNNQLMKMYGGEEQ